jgi:hypothetical protein
LPRLPIAIEIAGHPVAAIARDACIARLKFRPPSQIILALQSLNIRYRNRLQGGGHHRDVIGITRISSRGLGVRSTRSLQSAARPGDFEPLGAHTIQAECLNNPHWTIQTPGLARAQP